MGPGLAVAQPVGTQALCSAVLGGATPGAAAAALPGSSAGSQFLIWQVLVQERLQIAFGLEAFRILEALPIFGSQEIHILPKNSGFLTRR
jgi:hypothetical protein